MKIDELGERGLIERIVREFRIEKEVVTVGAGEDDCAVIDIDAAKKSTKYLVVTTNTLQQSTHFPDGMTPFQMGWSAVAVNLSDIAAMGAVPFAFTISIGIPAQIEVSFVDELVRGIEVCASTYNTAVIGGDVVQSKEIILTGMCIGFTNDPVRRSGANLGDLLCITGSLGNAALAMKIIKNELKVSEVHEHIRESAKKSLFQPQPRVDEGIVIANSGVVTSMIDISDGLAISIAELTRNSNLGAELYKESVPVFNDEIRRFDLSLSRRECIELAFYYGGDYELLFTIDPLALEDKKLMSKLTREAKMSIIGKMVLPEEGIYFEIEEDGLSLGLVEKEPIEIRGYQHF